MITREVELIDFGPEHFDRLIEWSPTPEFLLQWAGPRFRFPLDHAQLEALMVDPARLYTVVRDGEVIGHAEIGRIDRESGHGWLMRILVGDPAVRGYGVGDAIVRKLIAMSFGELDLERLYLHVLKSNEAAARLYERVGFTNCKPVLPRPETVQPMVLTRTGWLASRGSARRG